MIPPISPTTPLNLTPIHQPLQATVRVPGSKSLTNRALAIAALAEGTTTLTNALSSDDAQYFVNALKLLGFTVEVHRASSDLTPLRLTVQGLGGRLPAPVADLFVGNAGTAARFLTAFVTLGQGSYTIDGVQRMRQRPIGDLLAALTQLGANVSSLSGCPPVKVSASGLPGGTARVAGDTSSQFLSALLMVAPYAQAPVELLIERGLNSKPYVDMTIAIMADFGVQVERDGYRRFYVTPRRYQAQADYVIESDASAASYFFAAPAVCGGTVRVQNISRRSKQGDIAFLDVLAQMGCQVRQGEDWLEVEARREAPLRGVEVDLRNIPDTAQTLAAIAPFASTPTTIRGIASARVKETDRVSAMCTELRRLGVAVEEYTDGLKVYPADSIQPATLQTYDDHRMAMAFALIGLRVAGVALENPGCVSKTFPGYFEVLESLRN